MQLRKHQHDFSRAIDGIIAGSGVRDIFCHVVPGGGKSLLPILAGRLIKAGLADKIAWICPRMTLQDQGERNFLDPRFRQMLGYALTIRSATNDPSPARGTDGLITTYQAMAVDKHGTVKVDFERFRYILVLDEFHHLEDEGEWTEPIRELYDRAVLRVLLTGTLSRGDKKRVAFVNYRQTGEDEYLPIFEAGKGVLIRYGRKEAIRDRAIIPMEFHFADGVAKWEKKTGRVVERSLSADRPDANHALYTALSTEYAQELLLSAIEHWRLHKITRNPNAALLVVAASIEAAKEYTGILKRQGLQAEIATSDDTKEALRHMNALKAGKLRILVAVSMVTEGFDCPSVSHIACLTNIRTTEWIEQCFSRAVRVDQLAGPYEAQRAHIFAPSDPMMLEIARKIEDEQQEAAKLKGGPRREDKGERSSDGQGEGKQAPGGIRPLSSRLVNGNGAGQPDFFLENEPVGAAPVMVDQPVETPHEQETRLLQEIEAHIRQYAFNNRISPKRLNGELFEQFSGKRRRNMTVPELERCLSWARSHWPLHQIRGVGRRVATKARPLTAEWR